MNCYRCNEPIRGCNKRCSNCRAVNYCREPSDRDDPTDGDDGDGLEGDE